MGSVQVLVIPIRGSCTTMSGFRHFHLESTISTEGRNILLLGFTTTFAIIPDNTTAWDYRSAVYTPESVIDSAR